MKRNNKRDSEVMWNSGNYIDLGGNNGDSVLWFYNLDMKNLTKKPLYPERKTNITKNFNTFIFEANPFLCEKIYKTVEYVKINTQLTNFKIYCPVIVSVYEGVEKMTIDSDDYASSKYYESNKKVNRYRRVYNVKVINITKFLNENIPQYDFNVMKFDVEGEEYFIIPKLIENNLLSKFDVLYSEFHTGNVNNPLHTKAIDIFEDYKNYAKKNNIETYEETNITESDLLKYNKIYEDLIICKNNYYN